MTRAPLPGIDPNTVAERDRMVIYLAILMALFLAALDQTIVSTALPRMVEDLQGIDRYAWVATSYLLASTALALVYGKLADTYPRKHVTLGAVGLFLSGSMLCGLSGEFGSLPLLGDGMTQLVIFRGIQGAGGGGLFAMTFIVIADLFTPAERGRYQGLVGAVFGVASVLGPLVGGVLTDHAGGLIPGVEGWRWVFYVNVPVGAVAVWFIARRMPRLEPQGDRTPPDLLSGALLLGGLIPVTLALQLDKRRYPWLPTHETGARGLEAWTTLGLGLFGLLVLALFIQRSRTSRSPILDFRLFANDVFRTANLSTFFFGASFMSVTIFLPLYLVNVMGVSATRAGAALIPFSMGIVVAATYAGQAAVRIGYRKQIVVGGVLFGVASVFLANMGADEPYARVVAYMVLAGFGIGPSLPLFTLAIQNAVEVRFIGQATSASQFFRQTGATVGAAIMGTVLATSLGSAFASLPLPAEVMGALGASSEALLATGGAGLPEQVRAAFEASAVASGSPTDAELIRAEGDRVAMEIGMAVRSAFAQATSRIYWLTVAIVILATALSARVPELPLRTTHDRASGEGDVGTGQPPQ